MPEASYEAEMARLERELLQITDPRNGERVVAEIERTSPGDPFNVPDTDGDLVVTWKGDALAFRHTNMDQIGPVPYRRTGGHTGAEGELMLVADGVQPGEYGVASAFDVAPTVEELLGVKERVSKSGESVLSRLMAARQA